MDASAAMDVDVNPNKVHATLLSDIKVNIALIERTLKTKEKRFLTRAVRGITALRKRLTLKGLVEGVVGYVKSASLANAVSEALESKINPVDVAVPEVEVYAVLLVLLWLLDQNKIEKGIALSSQLIAYLSHQNHRTLDALQAKAFFYYSRLFELGNKLSEIRGELLKGLRTSTLRHDDDSLATIINLLLRNYLNDNLYDQADKLVSKTTFPERADNNQLARYMYYLGRIKAIQLDYTDSHTHLVQAIRKAPQSKATVGFLQAVNKLSIIVQLLMGEIPSRALFRNSFLSRSLVPYLELVRAVRVGDLNLFQDALKKYENVFKVDKTLTLIMRLRHNVIKTGIRMINLSYSKISLSDVCTRLGLECEEETEYILAKAIRDGVIDATIDHAGRFVQSKENPDVYSTTEPQKAFHQRLLFCLSIYDEFVKALRFPENEAKKQLESVLELERKEAVDIIMDDDDDEGMDF